MKTPIYFVPTHELDNEIFLLHMLYNYFDILLRILISLHLQLHPHCIRLEYRYYSHEGSREERATSSIEHEGNYKKV